MPFKIKLFDPPSLCRRTSIESNPKSDHLTLTLFSAEDRSNAIRNQIGPSFPLPPNFDRQPFEIRPGLPPPCSRKSIEDIRNQIESHSKSDRSKIAIVYVPSVPRVRRFTYPRFRRHANLRTLGSKGTQGQDKQIHRDATFETWNTTLYLCSSMKELYKRALHTTTAYYTIPYFTLLYYSTTPPPSNVLLSLVAVWLPGFPLSVFQIQGHPGPYNF